MKNADTKQNIEDKTLKPRKSFGQNFLIDKKVLRDIVKGSGITESDRVLEIGPGTGALTKELLGKASSVTAVEIDPLLTKLLREKFADEKTLRIVEGDILKTDLHELFPGEVSSRGRIKVVANIPYYITTPILMYLFDRGHMIESVTVMVQKEVALRLLAPPGGKDYGALTLAACMRADIRLLLSVPAASFYPRPKVASSVLRLDMYEEPPVNLKDEDMFFRVVRAAFSKRRKTLVNALRAAPALGLDRGTVLEALAEMDLRPDIRGERLSMEEFAALSNILCEKREQSL